MIITKLIHKLLELKKNIVVKGKKDKHALLSYVLFPPAPFDFSFFFNVSHNRYLKSYLMSKCLKSAGYTVHVYDYLNTDINYNIKYDIFIGHNKYFHDISNKLNEGCKKILLTTGSSPVYDNLMLEKRQEELRKYLGTTDQFYSPMKDIEYVNKNIREADLFFMIGNKKISKTWDIPSYKRIFNFSNVNLVKFKKKEKRTGNYIYFSSIGQLRRGLDLVLLAFKGRTEKVYICGDYSEPLFLKHFDKELNQSPNVIPMGFVDQTSKRFMDIVNDTDFVILPSCSEGQSGSVLTLMSHGLLPVISEAAGFDNCDSFGFKINDYSVSEIVRILDLCSSATMEEIETKRLHLLEQGSSYTPENFINEFKTLVTSL